MIGKKILLVFILTVLSCRQSAESMIPYLEGYWEISHVEKKGKVIKEFTMNTQVDYFEVHDDLSGFRKKVNPTLEGKFIVSKHQTPFALKMIGNDLQIHYSDNDISYVETILKVNAETLIIKNEDGIIYTYTPFESLDLKL
ncbi:MAG: hypothetical protein HKN54_02210 [Flavobacteriaceae bacterium]|nr:hypothetical protein [Flavobacteriaceae bacterium]